jgi:uncharacterized protein (DUF1015 family)
MEIYPFRGIRYNQRIVRDLAQVICPPYDVITPEQEDFYYHRSSHNVIRLEHPSESWQPTAGSYQRAAAIFHEWLEGGVLQFDDTLAFYLHDYYFTYLGEEKRRRGLMVRLKLAPWGSGIYPHEETSSRDKSDRLQVMRACQASFSPLFCLYRDSREEIASILSQAAQGSPVIELAHGSEQSEGSRERHIIWAITEPKLQQILRQLFSSKPIYMADGHHRYETALIYQRERMASSLGVSGFASDGGKETFNYVMVTLVEFSDPGLVIFPIHRLVRGITSPLTGKHSHGLSRLLGQLENFFTLKLMPLSGSVLKSLLSDSSYPLIAGDYLLGVLGLVQGQLVLLRERQDVSLEDMMPVNRSPAYRQFNISILNHVILGRILGLTLGEENVAYTVNTAEAYQRLSRGDYQLVFLLNPPQPEMVEAIVNAGDRMPRKSTYFYPKMPAGLIINSLK